MARVVGAVDRVRRDGVRCRGATGVAGVTAEKPNAPGLHAGARDSQRDTLSACSACVAADPTGAHRLGLITMPESAWLGKTEKPNAPDCSEARDLRSGDLPTMPEAAP